MACKYWKHITKRKIVARRDAFPEDWTIKNDQAYYNLNYCPSCGSKLNEGGCTNPNNELINMVFNIIEKLKISNYVTISNSKEELRKFENVIEILKKYTKEKGDINEL